MFKPFTRSFYAPKTGRHQGRPTMQPSTLETILAPLQPRTWRKPRVAFTFGPFINRPRRIVPTAQRRQRLARRATRQGRKH